MELFWNLFQDIDRRQLKKKLSVNYHIEKDFRRAQLAANQAIREDIGSMALVLTGLIRTMVNRGIISQADLRAMIMEMDGKEGGISVDQLRKESNLPKRQTAVKKKK
jgi:hypothetical protein